MSLINTVPLTELLVKTPPSLKAMLLSSYWPAAAVPTFVMVPFLNVKSLTCCPSMPLRPAPLMLTLVSDTAWALVRDTAWP